MKKILLLFCTVLVSVTASARYYDSEPDAGDWAIGLNMNSGSYYPLINFGLGTKLQYYATSAFRIEANFNWFIERKNVKNWDTNLNLHYTFPIVENLRVYPVVGANLMYGHHKRTRFCPGLNAGGGLQYNVAERVYVAAEAVYKYSSTKSLDNNDDYFLGPRAELTVSVAYRF